MRYMTNQKTGYVEFNGHSLDVYEPQLGPEHLEDAHRRGMEEAAEIAEQTFACALDSPKELRDEIAAAIRAAKEKQ